MLVLWSCVSNPQAQAVNATNSLLVSLDTRYDQVRNPSRFGMTKDNKRDCLSKAAGRGEGEREIKEWMIQLGGRDRLLCTRKPSECASYATIGSVHDGENGQIWLVGVVGLL